MTFARLFFRVSTDMKAVIYTGIFFNFSEDEKSELLFEAGALDRSDLPNTFLHHVTLEFRPDADRDHLQKVLAHEGEVVDVKVVGVTSKWKGIEGDLNPVAAFKVELGPTLQALGIECANETPHLTVATADGVRPVEANKVQYNYCSGPILTGRLGVFRQGD